MDGGAWWATVHAFMHWRRKWQPTPVFLPWESQGQGSLVGLLSMGSHRVRHDWSDLAAAAATRYHACIYYFKSLKTPLDSTILCYNNKIKTLRTWIICPKLQNQHTINKFQSSNFSDCKVYALSVISYIDSYRNLKLSRLKRRQLSET